MSRYYIFLLLLIFISNELVSQNTWSRVYGGPEDDFAYSVKQTPDGGYVVLGISGISDQSAWLLKLDENGDTVWTKSFDSTMLEYSLDIEIDYDSGYILAINKVTPSIDANLRIVKTDELGNIIWSEIYDLSIPTIDYPYDLDKTSDSGYIVVGNAMFQNSSTFIIKLDQNGDSVWATLTGEEMFFTGVIENLSNGYFATGRGNPYYGATIAEYDSLGNCISWKSYDDHYSNDIEMLKDSNYIVGTSTHLLKIDENLDTIWSRNIGAMDVEPCFDGGFVTTYFLNSDAYLNKYTCDGDSVWSVYFGGPEGDKFYSISRTTDGGYICCGHTNSWGNGGFDYYIVKTDSQGLVGVEEEFIQQYPQYPDITIENRSSRQVKISFIQPIDGNISFSVYDLSGRMIERPLEGFLEKGECTITLTGYRPGVYFYRMNVGEEEWRGKFQVY
ncbi:MAG: hypothetical protein ACP5FK_09755 [bacterium]